MREIWKLREHIAEALLHDGDGCFKVVSLDAVFPSIYSQYYHYGHWTDQMYCML